MRLNKLFDSFLSAYQIEGFVIQQKAKVILSVILMLIVLTLGFIFKIGFRLTEPTVFIFAAINLVNMFLLLWLLKKGYFSLSGHLLLLSMTLLLWFSLYLDNLTLIDRMDAIIMVFGIFTLSPLIIKRNKWAIFFYYFLNCLLLVVLSLFMKDLYNWSEVKAFSMIGDNILTLSLIAFVSYSILSINETALERAQKSILEAKTESNKNILLNQELEQKVEQRTAELTIKNEELLEEVSTRQLAEKKLKELQKELIDNAHKAGKAEIAASTLHNVGNVLSSLYTSATLVQRAVQESPLSSYREANQLLNENWSNLDNFMTQDPKGKKLLEYYLKLEEGFTHTFNDIGENADRMLNKAKNISYIITNQSDLSNRFTHFEKIPILSVIEETFEILPDSFFEANISIDKDFPADPLVFIQKSKLVHIFLNLFINAQHAMKNNPEESRKLWISVQSNQDAVDVSVRDSGIGISQENLPQIFLPGFTTRKEGYGFGLHSCAIYMEDMQGSIQALSSGRDKGAEFVLTLPKVK